MPSSPLELQMCLPKNFEGSLSFRFEIKETAEVDRLGDWHDREKTLAKRVLMADIVPMNANPKSEWDWEIFDNLEETLAKRILMADIVPMNTHGIGKNTNP